MKVLFYESERDEKSYLSFTGFRSIEIRNWAVILRLPAARRGLIELKGSGGWLQGASGQAEARAV